MLNSLGFLLSRREKVQAAGLLGLMMLGAALEMLGVGAIPAFVALLNDPSQLQTHPWIHDLLLRVGVGRDARMILRAGAVLLAVFIVKNTYLTILTYLQSRYTNDRQVSIADRLFRAYMNAPYEFHLTRNSADLLRNIHAEALDVVAGVLIPSLTLSMELFTISAILTLLVFVEPVVSLAAFGVLGGATFLYVRVMRRRLLAYAERMQRHRSAMYQAVSEGLGAVKIATLTGSTPLFLSRFNAASRDYARASRVRQVAQEVPRLFLEIAAVGGLLLIAGLLLTQHRAARDVIPVLSLMGIAIVRMVPSFNRITSALTAMRYGRRAIHVVYADLRALEHPNHDASPTASDPSAFVLRDRIRLDDVSYRYPGATRPALANVTLDVARGATIAFVGATGAGKTTLVDLVLGLLEPSDGRLLIDGRDVRQCRAAWQRHVAYVPQEIYLIDDTIARNVAFGCADDRIDHDALQRALREAQLETFVAQLPEGASTRVGERGVRLSGGQRQRIAIARALYRDPSVLVLDEATSALDGGTESSVMDAISRLRGRRTIIIIAHRMSTVRACDQLILLSEGRVVASGTYDELMHAEARFRQLAVAR